MVKVRKTRVKMKKSLEIDRDLTEETIVEHAANTAVKDCKQAMKTINS